MIDINRSFVVRWDVRRALLVALLTFFFVGGVFAQISYSYTLPDGRVLEGTVNPDGTVTYSVEGDSITIDPLDPNYIDELTAWANRLFGVGLQADTVAESRTYHEQVAGNYRNITRSVSTLLSQGRANARSERAASGGGDGGEDGDGAEDDEVSPLNNFLSLDSRFESYSDDSDTDGELSGITNFGYTWMFDPKTDNGGAHSRFLGLTIGVSGLRDDVPTGLQTTVIGVNWGRLNMTGSVPGSVATSAATFSFGVDQATDDLRTQNGNLFYSFTMPIRIQGQDWGTVAVPVSYNLFVVYFSDGIGTMSTTTLDSPFAVDLLYPIAGGFELFWSNMLSIRWIEGTTVSDDIYGEGDSDTLAFGAYTADIGARYRVTERVGLTAGLSVGTYPGSVTSIGLNAGVVY